MTLLETTAIFRASDIRMDGKSTTWSGNTERPISAIVVNDNTVTLSRYGGAKTREVVSAKRGTGDTEFSKLEMRVTIVAKEKGRVPSDS